MFVDTPRMRNSATARRARRTAVGKSRPRHVSLTSIESKCALTSAPRCVPPSSRMPAPPGTAVGRDAPGVRPEPVGRVLGGDPALQRRPVWDHRFLAQPKVFQGFPARDAQLRRHQVDVGDLLGDRVLDLDPRVHLDEHVLTALVEQELHGARAGVTDLAGERHRVGADLLPQRRIQVRRRRQLDDLLVAALHAAVALEQMDHVAVRVGQDLHLDVAGIDHRLLEEHRRIPERRLRFAAGRFDRLRQSGRVARPDACRGRRRRRRP